MAIDARQTILISGGTSTGKTTLLNALAACLPPIDRIVLIEDTAELQVNQPNVVRFEARRAQRDLPAVTIRDLLKATLRHRPDRIIVGEVRGGEAYDLLQALNTGHAGTLSTIHANSADQALARFDVVRPAGGRRAAVSGGPPPDRRLDRRGAAPGSTARRPKGLRVCAAAALHPRS